MSLSISWKPSSVPASRLAQISSHLRPSQFATSLPSFQKPGAARTFARMSSTSLPDTMRAIVITKTGGPEVLETHSAYPTPVPKPTEVLVKNTFAGINYIDTYFRKGTYASPKPEILGREGAGTIAALGDSVDPSLGFKAGDRVVWTNWTQGYAEYTTLPAEKVVKIPDDVSDEDAASGFLMGMTAITILRESYEVKKGDTILIHAAAGGTGLLMVQLAKSIGATVIGTAGGPEKCKLAKDNGADYVIDYTEFKTKEEWVPKVLALTPNGEGVDAVFDGVGKTTWDGSIDAVKRKGSVLFFGASSGPIPDVPVKILMGKNIKLMRPSMEVYCHTRAETEFYSNLFFDYIKTGKFKIKIHKIYDLEDVQQAHIDLAGRVTSGKLLLKI